MQGFFRISLEIPAFVFKIQPLEYGYQKGKERLYEMRIQGERKYEEISGFSGRRRQGNKRWH